MSFNGYETKNKKRSNSDKRQVHHGVVTVEMPRATEKRAGGKGSHRLTNRGGPDEGGAPNGATVMKSKLSECEKSPYTHTNKQDKVRDK